MDDRHRRARAKPDRAVTAKIRNAVDADADRLARLGAETFIATFGHLYAAKDLNAFLAKNHTVDVYRSLLADPEFMVFIAETDAGEAVGYAVAGPSSLPVPDPGPHSGELARLYLTKEAQGAGLGARLLEVALEFLRDRFERIYLSVYAENAHAQRLYRRYGFVKIRDYFYKVGDHLDPEWIMELKPA
ncbi:MAG: GNAT family N-acetyltransferase [Parvularculaceae bacterium]|nr:GNAT family N-acetyltransferase [Parvularculaceae bacterium]